MDLDIVIALSSLPAEIEQATLNPTDHGRDAYLVLLGCTLIQAPIWGISFDLPAHLLI